MIPGSVLVFCLLGVAVGLPVRSYDDHVRYQGPPAPLNPDGTVAFTPEYEHIRDAHSALYDREYHRIKETFNDPDPHSIKYQAHSYISDGSPEVYNHDTNESPAEDEGIYKADLYEDAYRTQYDDGQYRPHIYEQEQQNGYHYSSSQSAQDTSYKPTYVPATLKADGTVANTPEYNSIASSFLAYHQALSRHRRSTERYEGPPAPLNQDFTVDYTPEIKHFNTAHFTAVANQFKKLQETAALAAAHPDRTSPPSKDYNPQNSGQYHSFNSQPHNQGHYLARKKRSGDYRPQQSNSRHYDDGQYRPHLYKHDDGQYKPQLYHVVDYNTVPYHPAPLNPDGTVAHLPEYHTIAASHRAAHHHALSSAAH